MILFNAASNSIHRILMVTSGLCLHDSFLLHLDRMDCESTHGVALHAERAL